ncbi:cell wall metabolism sensor histidine kinase WalK [Prolixibacter sp. NT017]|uniref:sensor histidine kinase n=1 Tax=Prolixibacter sp. NT017 TaxID=2652390 RepID=UPI001271FBE4|nr:ATP-binding protein [Prolixibacter sp. NT017]GET25745.1 two-component sensor histidine kinase [Prolixibacter sp. NT017]
MRLSFSNRIALYYMGTTAILTLVVFFFIYMVVHQSVYRHLDSELSAESEQLNEGFVILDGEIVMTNPYEWNENEHEQVEVNPIFMQISDIHGQIIKRTPNLYGDSLNVYLNRTASFFINTTLSRQPVRQLQTPIFNSLHELKGYMDMAVPLESTIVVLRNLRRVLILAFPVVLILLFFITSLIARRSIHPVFRLTETAEKISRENLGERIPLPLHEDELYTLTQTINQLLERLEDAVIREKQFTSDASHELRTPLSILKGTLEVMLRKSRDPEYYIEKISSSLSEVNRMSDLVDKLLMLARYEGDEAPVHLSSVDVQDLLEGVLARFETRFAEKNLKLALDFTPEIVLRTDRFMLEQIVENLITNAIKYSPANSKISIFLKKQGDAAILALADEGPGIPKHALEGIFDRFYRVDESRNSFIEGNGLGLALVRRFCGLLHIKPEVKSEPGKGTEFILFFPEENMTETDV